MPLGGGLIAGIGAIGSAVAGGISSSNQLGAATDARQAALQQWLNVNVPDPAQQKIELQRYKVTGQFSPSLQKAFQQSSTGLKDINLDPSSRAAEVDALTQMQDIASHGGMDAQSKEKEQEAINTANANERGQRGAIQQSFAARGVGGAGAELAAQLEASQGDANQASAQGQASAAAAEQRALQAMTNSSQMASNLNSQDYKQAAAAAEAQDSINRFNTQNSQNVSNNNTNTVNDAQKYNLDEAQKIADLNTGVGNTEETHNKGLLQQQFQNETAQATGRANAENGVANQAVTNAGNTADMWGGIGNAISQAGTGIAKNANSTASTQAYAPGTQTQASLDKVHDDDWSNT